MIALACGVLGFVAGLVVCGAHWAVRIREEIATASPETARVLKRLLRWPA